MELRRMRGYPELARPHSSLALRVSRKAALAPESTERRAHHG